MSKCALTETVETLGLSAWIICRSKSYTNRLYYFNTLTGQAVWNLSKAEIEKARRSERNSLKSNFSVEDCPEPEGSPEYNFPSTMNPNNNRMRNERLRPKVYNKQVINNRFTRTSDYSPMNTIPMGIPVAAALYNPLIWNVPPQQVFLGPYSTSPNVNSQLPVSETSVPLSKRFSSYNETRNIQPTYMKTQRSQFSMRSAEGVSSNSIHRIRDNADLRQKLLARRTSRSIETCQGRDEKTYEPPMQQNEETLLYIKDEDWLAKNLHKNPCSIDTQSIKDLFNMEDNGFWYIVTDTIVLLSNTNFMRVLLNYDKQCNLILPKAVFEEIEGISKSNLNPPANQALAFISQEIILNQAIIDEETLSDTGLYVQDEILGCCSRLSEQGFPVILLTNNVEILDLKDSVTYQIFTMKEFKTHVCRPTESVKKYLPLNDTERNIKITIPNKLNEVSLKQQTEDAMNDNEVVEPTIISRVVLEKETNDIDLLVPCERENEAQDHAQYNTITNVENDTRLSRRKILNRQRSQDSTKNTGGTTKNLKWQRKSNAKENVDEFNKPEERNIKESLNISQPSGSDMKKTNNSEIACQSSSSDINKTNSPEKVTINDSSRVANEDEDNDVILIKTEPLSPKRNVSKDDKNVMFEITSQSMEDNLKLKCDEWVSRFIQIMEEVLTQILHREPKFVCDAIPPPWTLYEATECTRKKFQNDGDIVDAANKLRNILFDIGGSRGKVKLNISPMEYMEMYSYGVYLTDTLQSAITECEDLQIAAESLYKLLSDIQDTNADINHDSLCNITNEEIEKIADQDVENNIIQSNDKQNAEMSNVKAYQLKEVPDFIVRKKNPQPKNTTERSPANSKSSIISNEITSPSKYFLRSSRKSTPQKERTTCTSKWDFLNKLDLTRTSSLEDFEPSLDQEVRDLNTSSAGCREPCQDNQRLIQGPILSNQGPSDDNQEPLLDNQGPNTDSQGWLADNQEQCQENDSKSNNFSNSVHAQNNKNNDNTQSNNVSEEKVMHPKIIRNFVRCIEFEEKLKKNVDFTQDFSFNEDFDFQCEDEYYNVFDYDDYEYDDSQNNDYGYEFDGDYGYDEEEKQLFEEEVNNMNCLIKEVVTETKTVFTLVKNFCEKCCELLSSSTTFDKTDTLQEAENASKSLDGICETLDSILKREAGTSKNSIKAVSINPELNCIEMSDEEVNKYREVISKSLEQGKLLKETITMIIKAIKFKT